MAETEMHAFLKRKALEFLKEKGQDVVVNECQFKCGISDAVGLNYKRKEVRVVECKAVKSDYIRDKKLFTLDKSYYAESHYFYIMCPENIIQPEDVIKGIGLLWIDAYGNCIVKKKPIKNTKKLRSLFETTLKFAIKRMSNELFYKDEKQFKDITAGKYERKADICLVSTICPKCRHSTKDLINKKTTAEMTCSHCKETIDLSKAKVRDITGYNKTFINKLKSLE